MKKIIAPIFFLSLSFTACVKLDRVPSTVADASVYFKDAVGIQTAVNGMYSVFQNDKWGGGLLHLIPHSDGLTEDAMLQFEYQGQWGNWALGNITPGYPGVVVNKWEGGYRGVTRANLVLANVDDPNIQITDAERKQYKGEALFIRAWCYSIMMTHYGDVPLILKPISIEESRTLSRTAKAEVLKQIVADYDGAAQNLGTIPPNNEYGRATKQAALSAKARILLYDKQYAAAAAAAKAVIDLEPSGAVRLAPDYESLFNGNANNDPESIFAVQALGQTATRPDVAQGSFLAQFYGLHNVDEGSKGWGSISYGPTMFDAYYMKDGLPITSSPLYDPAHPYENRDPRLLQSFLVPGLSTWYGQPYTTLNYSGSLRDKSIYIANKKWLSEKDVLSYFSNVNFILIRYSDVLLMYAEAQNEVSGPDASIYASVNKVRARSHMPDFTAGLTQDQMRQEIRHERKVELSQEGLRFYDLRRWGLAVEKINANTLQTRNFKDYMLLLPIPQGERDLNPKLTQNPGYGN